MDQLLFHPKLVHLPMALAVLMPLLAVGLWLAWWRKWLPARSWILVVALQAVLVGSALLALQSGEAHEEAAERFAPEAAIEAHEEAAEFFVVVSAVTWLLMAAALATSRSGLGHTIAAVAAGATLVVFAQGYRTGQAGGELVYRYGAAAAFTNSSGSAAGREGAEATERSFGEHEEHEDDD